MGLASRLTWSACYCTFAALGIFMCYLALDGIWSGEVAIFSKRVSGAIGWASSPFLFVGTLLAWLLGAFFLLRIAAGGWRELRDT